LIKDLPGDVDNKVVPLQRSQSVLPASFGVAFAGVPTEAPFGLARFAGTGLLLNPVQTGYGYRQGAQQKLSSPFSKAISGPWLAYRRVSQTPIYYAWALAMVTLAVACSNFETFRITLDKADPALLSITRSALSSTVTET